MNEINENQLLKRVFSIAASTQQPKAILQSMCEELGHALDVPVVAFSLLNAKRTHLTVFTEYCIEGHPPALNDVIPIAGSPSAQFVIEKCLPLVVDDVQNDTRLLAKSDRIRQRGIASFLIAPVSMQGLAIGTLSLDTITRRRFSDDVVTLIQSVANVAGQTLENAHLHDTLQQEKAVRKQLASELQHQRDFALVLMDAMGEGLTMINAQGKFEYVNPAFAMMLGYVAQELVGKTPLEITLPEDHDNITQNQSRALTGVSTIYEARLAKANGETVYTMVTAVPRWKGSEVVGTIEVFTDISARQQAEEALADAREQALDASRLKTEFMTTMSHELRTPMTAIIGMSELLLDTSLDDEQREYATVTRDASRALLTIIDDILDYSQIEAGELELAQVSFQLSKVIDWTKELFLPKVREKHLTLTTDLDPQIPSIMQGDPARLRQALLNLVSNAVKFTERGGVSIRATLENKTDDHVMVRFTVSDTGVGLTKTGRLRLYQPLTQGDGSLTRRYGGTGMGVALSRKIVDLMGGDMGVETKEGSGSKFWFTARFET